MESSFSGDNVELCLSEKIDDTSFEILMKLGLADRFPKAFETWKKSRENIIQRAEGILSERQKEMHIKLERDLESINVEIREAVIIEVLKAFP